MNHDDVIPADPPADSPADSPADIPAARSPFNVANDFSQSVLVKLKIGDQVSFYVSDLPFPPTENYADGCKTGDITHSCSTITGEYLYL